MEETSRYWIEHLKLQQHPEGGFFRETYRAEECLKGNALPDRFGGTRSFSTAIYFLLRSEDKSHLHKIKSDELWHFYCGSSLTIYILNERGLTKSVLGSPLNSQGSFQVLVPANSWFGAMVNEKNAFVLAGCTVAPGFDFKDFEMADRDTLMKTYPEQAEIINTLTL